MFFIVLGPLRPFFMLRYILISTLILLVQSCTNNTSLVNQEETNVENNSNQLPSIDPLEDLHMATKQKISYVRIEDISL